MAVERMRKAQESGYYSVLEIDVDASPSVIVKAYRSMALKYHPDKNPNARPDQFIAINEAYEVLSDPKKRRLPVGTVITVLRDGFPWIQFGMYYCHQPSVQEDVEPPITPERKSVSVSDYVTITFMGLLVDKSDVFSEKACHHFIWTPPKMDRSCRYL
ncbi:dnaj homolog subfamily a member 1-like [Plasmopara halstedii]|uniref:Dnaj homolog subfamily a member 1-like n=1 Tax=Plasmopara halstedii TaxID=4781 RepID=A0A0P1B5J6_PLAHL|nr:dnaj homolog subfamily a member 1-like [Plasmopara halstedii]CEG49682.1 dnaj homolog subfamily a member 1-like [Plasmopara halstedii]|eukprot:XP_024586051.1 dnaj homolog subfamily a member 1-like [Plasmopara halstedii]